MCLFEVFLEFVQLCSQLPPFLFQLQIPLLCLLGCSYVVFCNEFMIDAGVSSAATWFSFAVTTGAASSNVLCCLLLLPGIYNLSGNLIFFLYSIIRVVVWNSWCNASSSAIQWGGLIRLQLIGTLRVVRLRSTTSLWELSWYWLGNLSSLTETSYITWFSFVFLLSP